MPEQEPTNTPDKTQRELDLDKREAELNKFKKDLMGVHDTLKGQADLFNALKEQGVETADDLTTMLSAQKQETAPTPTADVKMPSMGNNTEVAELKKTVEQLSQKLQQQGLQMQTGRLMSDIKAKIANNPEYQLLAKGLNEGIAFNLLRQIENDKAGGKEKDLEHYLKPAEQELRTFYTQLGGKIEEKKSESPDPLFGSVPQQQSEGKTETGPPAQQNSPDNPASSSGSSAISFPSLPSHGSGDSGAGQASVKDRILSLGKNPVTGKFDDSAKHLKTICERLKKKGPYKKSLTLVGSVLLGYITGQVRR